MATTVFGRDEGKPIAGYKFAEMAAFLIAFRDRSQRSPDSRWCVNGFKTMTTHREYEDSRSLDRGILCYDVVPRKPSFYSSARERMLYRWTLQMDYRKSESGAFDIENTFRLTDRHDKHIGEERCKLHAYSITLETHWDGHEQPVADELVEQEIKSLIRYFREVEADTSSLLAWAASRHDVIVRCRECNHTKTARPADITRLFSGLKTVEQASSKLRCSNCQARGRVALSPSTDPVALLP